MKSSIDHAVVLAISVLFTFTSLAPLAAQDHTMPYRGRLEITAGEGYIYDNGGPFGSYWNDCADTLIIRPAVPGTFVELHLHQFVIHSYSDDYIEVYNGDDFQQQLDLGGAFPEFLHSSDPAGALSIVFVSDEVSTSDGFKIYFTTIDKIPVTDLSIISYALEQQEIVPGDFLTVNSTIENLGPSGASMYKVDYYLSEDSIFDAGDMFLNSVNCPALAPGQYTTVQCELGIPAESPVGDHFIVGRITDALGEPDSIPGNSNFSARIEVVEPEVELILASVGEGSRILFSNLPFTLNYEIELQGNYNLQGLKTGLYLSDDMFLDAGDLLMGEQREDYIDTMYNRWCGITIDSVDFSGLTEGMYYLILVIDNDNQYEEPNEENNRYVTQLLLSHSYQPRENLVMRGIRLMTDTISNDTKQEVTFSMRSENIWGSATLDLFISLDTILDDDDWPVVSIVNWYYGSGDNEATREINIYVEPEPGMLDKTYHLIARLDGGNEIRERNEADNIAHTPVYITGTTYHDIGFANYKINCDSLLNNHRLIVQTTVANNGSAMSDPGQVYFYLSEDQEYNIGDAYLGASYYPGSLAGGSYTRSFVYEKLMLHSPGDYHIICRLDTLNEIAETDETNNMLAIPFRIIDPADFDSLDAVLLDIIAPDTIQAGERKYIGFSYVFMNNQRGSLHAAGYISKDSALNIEDLGTRIFSGGFNCDALQELQMMFDVNIPPDQDTGKHYLVVKLDDYNYLDEDNETNNLLIQPVYFVNDLQRIVDLELAEIDLDNPVLGSSSMLTGNISIIPRKSELTDTTYVMFYIADKDVQSEQLIHTDTLLNIYYSEVTRDFSIALPPGLENGNYELRCKLRTGAGQVDKDTTNNEAVWYFAVQDTDLDFALNDLQSDRDKYHLTEPLTVTFDVINNGTTLPANPGCSFYLSTDQLLSADDVLVLTETLPDLGIQHTFSRTRSINIPAGTAPGEYFLLGVLDPENAFNETDESNNFLSVSFDLLENGSNLTIKELNINTEEIVRGIYFSVTATLTNTGNYYAGSSITNVYLSEDMFYGENDTYLNGMYTYSLSPGSSREIDAYIDLPDNISPGTYYILLIADANNDVEETDEEDNMMALQVNVISPDFDLKISGSSIVDTLRTMENSIFGLELKIRNAGVHTLNKRIKVLAYISKDSIFDPFTDVFAMEEEVYADFEPGTDVRAIVYIYLPEVIEYGDYHLFFFVDATDVVDESDEMNNVFSIPLVVTDMDVDIAFTSLSVAPDTMKSGGAILCNFTVINQGATYSGNNLRVNFYMSEDTIKDSSDKQFDYKLFNPLDAQSEVSGTVSYRVPSYYYPQGKYYVIAVADEHNGLKETNEENNICFAPVYIEPLDIDLTMPYTVTSTPADAYAGDRVSIYYRVFNAGTDGITQNFRTGYYFSTDTVYDASDTFIGYDYFSWLGGQASASRASEFFVPMVPPGEYYLIFVADYNNNVYELNESNNSTYVAFHVKTEGVFPDYAIEVNSFNHELPSNEVRVQFDLTNVGLEAAGSATICSFYASVDAVVNEEDYFLGKVDIAPLVSEETIDVSFQQLIPGTGYNYFIIVADPNGFISDENRYNNVVVLALETEPPYDLDLECTLETPTCYPGTAVEITSRILRQGPDMLNPVLIEYYISRDSMLEFVDEPVFSRMLILDEDQETIEHFSYEMPETAETGTYYAMIYLNQDSVWIESHAGNNYGMVVFEVIERPYETVDVSVSLPFSTPPVRAGETIEINSTLRNNGTFDIEQVVLNYYLSADAVIDQPDVTLHIDTIAGPGTGSMMDISQEVVIPVATAPGDYAIILQAVALGELPEPDTIDNIAVMYCAIDSPTIIEDQESISIRLYPNPATQFVTVESSAEMLDYSLSGMDGKIIRNGIIRNTTTSMNVEALAAGLYTLIVNTSEGQKVLKFAVR